MLKYKLNLKNLTFHIYLSFRNCEIHEHSQQIKKIGAVLIIHNIKSTTPVLIRRSTLFFSHPIQGTQEPQRFPTFCNSKFQSDSLKSGWNTTLYYFSSRQLSGNREYRSFLFDIREASLHFFQIHFIFVILPSKTVTFLSI